MRRYALAQPRFWRAGLSYGTLRDGAKHPQEAMVRMLPRLAGYSKPSPCLWHGATILKGWFGNSTRVAIANANLTLFGIV
jgi:hypothetical protein